MHRRAVLLLSLALALLLAEPAAVWAESTTGGKRSAVVKTKAKATAKKASKAKSAKATGAAKSAKLSKKGKRTKTSAREPSVAESLPEPPAAAEPPAGAEPVQALAFEALVPAPVETAAPAPAPIAPTAGLVSPELPDGPSPAAPPTLEETAPSSPSGLGLGLLPKVGGVFPQALNRLGTSCNVALELSYAFPFLSRRLAVGVEAAYAQPPHSRTISDPRVPDGAASYTITERIFGVYFGPKYYFLPPSSRLLPFVSAGVRAQMISTGLEGSAGTAAFAEQSETGTHVAFAGQAGLGLKLGPGHAVLELQATSSPIDHFVTGKVDVGDLGLRAGYLLQL